MKPNYNSRRPSTGYTLTEMLVVFGIIILVATISIPAILPLTRGRHMRTSSSITSAALMNIRMYAVNRRVTAPCIFFQATPTSSATDFGKIGNLTACYSYLETIMSGKVYPSELAQFVQILPYRFNQSGVLLDAFPVTATTAGNKYTPFMFKADGTVILETGAPAVAQAAMAIRIYIVDLRTVPPDTWPTAWTDQNRWATPPAPDDKVIRNSVYKAIEINKLTGRVRIIDPDRPD